MTQVFKVIVLSFFFIGLAGCGEQKEDPEIKDVVLGVPISPTVFDVAIPMDTISLEDGDEVQLAEPNSFRLTIDVQNFNTEKEVVIAAVKLSCTYFKQNGTLSDPVEVGHASSDGAPYLLALPVLSGRESISFHPSGLGTDNPSLIYNCTAELIGWFTTGGQYTRGQKSFRKKIQFTTGQ